MGDRVIRIFAAHSSHLALSLQSLWPPCTLHRPSLDCSFSAPLQDTSSDESDSPRPRALSLFDAGDDGWAQVR